MKALALDTSISCIQIAAKNDDNLASLILDIGMRQSEKLLPAIDYVMRQADLTPGELDYTVLCEGPGSFTGLRLGFAALKAIELFGGTSANENSSQDQKAGGSAKIPLYGINSLDFLAHPFLDFDGIVLPVIDAHKEKFYAKAFFNGKEILPCDDWDLRALEEKLLAFAQAQDRADENCLQGQKSGASGDCLQDQKAAAQKILVCGLEAQTFAASCKENGLFKGFKIAAPKARAANIESLFILAQEKIARNEPPLADYDGPKYYRASEAEQKAAETTSQR